MASRKRQPRHRLTIRDASSWEVVYQGIHLADEIEQAVEDEIGLNDYVTKVGVTVTDDYRIQVSQPSSAKF